MLDSLSANAALLLAFAGLLLVCVEFCFPGAVAPGVAGGVLLVCGVHRLAQLGASAPVSGLLLAAFAVIASAGFGWLPSWMGWLAIPLIPWLAYSLVPGAVHWAAALASLVPAVVVYALLRIAARALANKTIMD